MPPVCQYFQLIDEHPAEAWSREGEIADSPLHHSGGNRDRKGNRWHACLFVWLVIRFDLQFLYFLAATCDPVKSHCLMWHHGDSFLD